MVLSVTLLWFYQKYFRGSNSNNLVGSIGTTIVVLLALLSSLKGGDIGLIYSVCLQKMVLGKGTYCPHHSTWLFQMCGTLYILLDFETAEKK